MDAFLKRPKRKASPEMIQPWPSSQNNDEPTEVKLAILSSLHPDFDQETLLDLLLAHEGSVTQTSATLATKLPPGRRATATGYQQSLMQYGISASSTEASPTKKRLKSKRGSTLHLYSPDDVAGHTPCSIIHNFLPVEDANALLTELLEESRSYEKITFKLFDNVVTTPHTSSFYVESYNEIKSQMTDYHYNGAKLDVRLSLVWMIKVYYWSMERKSTVNFAFKPHQ